MKGQNVLLLLIVGVVGIGAYKTYKVRQEEIPIMGGGSVKLGLYQDTFDQAKETGDTSFITDPYLREQIEYDLHEIRRDEETGSPTFDPATIGATTETTYQGTITASLTTPKRRMEVGDGFRTRVKFSVGLTSELEKFTYRVLVRMPRKEDKRIFGGQANTSYYKDERVGLEMPGGRDNTDIKFILQISYGTQTWTTVDTDTITLLRQNAVPERPPDVLGIPTTTVIPTTDLSDKTGDGDQDWAIVSAPMGGQTPTGSVTDYQNLDEERAMRNYGTTDYGDERG